MTENQNSNADGERPTPHAGQRTGIPILRPSRRLPVPPDKPRMVPIHRNRMTRTIWMRRGPRSKPSIRPTCMTWLPPGRPKSSRSRPRNARRRRCFPATDDLDIGSFTDDALRPSRGGKRQAVRSLRFHRLQLDTDNVMDTYDDGFTPPNPDLGPVKASTVLLTALLIIGLVGEAVMIFVPGLNAIPLLGALLSHLLFGLASFPGSRVDVHSNSRHANRPSDQGRLLRRRKRFQP